MRPYSFAILVIALALGGCGGLGGEPEIVATVAPSTSTESAQPIPRVWQPDIANGARIFAERCVDCHGEDGDGRGELVLAGSVERPLDMTERASAQAKSPLDWFEIITEGRIENLMPPWEAALSEAERWDVTLFSYTLAYDEALMALGESLWRKSCAECELPTIVPPVYSDVEYGAQLNRERFRSTLTAAQAEAAAAYARMRTLTAEATNGEAAARFDLSGRVQHGTGGGIVPAETVVQLRYGNGDSGYRVAETTIDAAGEFRFEAIPRRDDFDYGVGALYDGRLFNQRVIPERDEERIITIYDATNDPLVVSVARILLSVEPVSLEGLGFGLYISQILTFRNSSDRIYTSGRGFDDGREASLLVQFPKGARLVSGDADGRYVVIEAMEGLPDSVIDTLPLLPGEEHYARLAYWLPFADAAQFEQSFSNLIDAEVLVTLTDELRVESDWLRQRPDAMAGEGYIQYSAELTMEAEPQVNFVISSDDGAVITSDSLPALLLAAIALAAALLGAIGLMKRRKDESGREIAALAAELARLEADHDQGRINHDLYHRRRRALKANLAQRLGASDD